MASKVITETISDVSGSPDAAPLRFSLDGKDYVIDVTADEARALRSTFTPWLEAGRRRKPSTK